MTDIPEMIQVRIMLLVGSNGKVSAINEGAMGWGDLADNIMGWEDKRYPTDPDASARYIVEVEVPVPSAATHLIAGKLSPHPLSPNTTEKDVA